VRNAVREDVGDRNLESDREDVEAREYVLPRRAASSRDSTEIVPIQVNQIENPLLIENWPAMIRPPFERPWINVSTKG
jgi:hypothetical protein